MLSPCEIIDQAISLGIDLLAITDHDTIEGYREACAYRSDAIRLIAGTELSASWGKIGIHLVALGFDPTSGVLLDWLARQSELRMNRAQAIAGSLERSGITNALAGASEIAGSADPGRAHFAEYLVQAGFAPNRRRAFSRFLGDRKLGGIDTLWPSVGQTVETINAAGGRAVLAHPGHYDLTRGARRRLIAEFADAGGTAIELHYASVPTAPNDELLASARHHELAISTGSDFHRPAQPWAQLGHVAEVVPGTPVVWAEWLN